MPAALVLSLLASSAGAKETRLPRAALVAGTPLPPGPAALQVLHQKLGAGYLLVEDPAVKHELEVLEREQGPEQLVSDALKDAMQRMRRLALEEVQRALDEAEPYVQQLPPSPGGRALLCAVAVRKAHVALLLSDTAAAEVALQRGLSADPDFTLDQAREPPTLVELFQRVQKAIKEAPRARIRVTTNPVGATVVVGDMPQGAAPLDITAPADVAITVWAVQEGYHPRNVTARIASKPERPLSVEIQLNPVPPAQQLRPLLDALRGAAPPERPAAAQALTRALRVEAVVLAELGPSGQPRLSAYGEPPRWPPSLLAGDKGPRGLDLRWEPMTPKRRQVPPWLWGIVGTVIGGAITTGVILGTR